MVPSPGTCPSYNNYTHRFLKHSGLCSSLPTLVSSSVWDTQASINQGLLTDFLGGSVAMGKREERIFTELSPQGLPSCRGSGEPKSYPRPSQLGEGPRGWAGS